MTMTLDHPADEPILHAADYCGQPVSIAQGQDFRPWPSRSYTCITPLTFLHGRPWDDVALAYVHALRPSRIRVVEANRGQQLDARCWRVTVQLDEVGKIAAITQEVEVGLPEGVPHGQALDTALEHGLGSPQLAWENAEGNEVWNGIDGTRYKITEDGKRLDYPE